jgi:hypothetical protein
MMPALIIGILIELFVISGHVTNEHGKTIIPVTLRAFEIATYRLELA